ncbi:MAG: hypothetical protein H6581_07325 [Bacteroidia bacterium]|nr:hypothetical protein [Bacteroidia bacterium]
MKKWLKWAGYLIFILLLLAVTAEITVRLMGYQPWSPPLRNSASPDGKPFFLHHETYGFLPDPAARLYTLNDQLTFHTQHNKEGFRLTSQIENDTLKRDEIWILGGSFTYGWGIETEESFPFLLQNQLPELKIRNFGVPAFGPHQSFDLLHNQLGQSPKPKMVVLAYASFHNQRVTCNDFWLKALAGLQATEGFYYPWFRLENGEQKRGMQKVAYHPLPGQKISAFVHFLEIQGNHAQEKNLQSFQTTRELLEDMVDFCRENQITFCLAGLEPDAETVAMLDYFRQMDGVVVCDISVDRSEPGMSLEPIDPHPSAAAHEIYAEKLVNCLLELPFSKPPGPPF